MQQHIRKWAVLALLATPGLAAPAWADGLASLEAFVRQAKAGTAQFTQTVTSPAKAGQAPRVQSSSGSFSFQRPGQFKFVYTQPFAQTIVADGQTLWLYDEDLEQVTRRPQGDALAGTPAALLTSVQDMAALRKDFDLAAQASAQPDPEGLQWVQATPKNQDGQIQQLRVGFTPAGVLAALQINDSFGQQSLLRFTQMALSPGLPAGSFHFQTPAGVSVLDQ
ncbi:MAG: outer membrane lipoprotein chaperone LolA [Comamonas sp.]|nr:outer membrane lipoprotein chaperone LolA [Comamonas sp.]MBS7243079.1 outer membrane lipoprotein chaperone LolA [Comamonas sp.]